jgi:hypothetical protein
MGAIVSDFPNLPQDADPARAQIYQRAYVQLFGIGLALPAQPSSTITRAQFLAHLQGLVGELIKAELTADPDNVGYGGTNAQKADAVGNAYQPNMRRFQGSNPTGYQTAAGSLPSGLVAVTNPGLAAPAFDALEFPTRRAGVRFRLTTPTAALRGEMRLVVMVPASDQLTLGNNLPGGVVPAGEVFDLIQIVGGRLLPARLYQLTIGIPFCPNSLTAADVAAAQL